MADDKWDGAIIEEKLEILWRDIISIQDAQNRTAHQFREVTRPLADTVAQVGEALNNGHHPSLSDLEL